MLDAARSNHMQSLKTIQFTQEASIFRASARIHWFGRGASHGGSDSASPFEAATSTSSHAASTRSLLFNQAPLCVTSARHGARYLERSSLDRAPFWWMAHGVHLFTVLQISQNTFAIRRVATFGKFSVQSIVQSTERLPPWRVAVVGKVFGAINWTVAIRRVATVGKIFGAINWTVAIRRVATVGKIFGAINWTVAIRRVATVGKIFGAINWRVAIRRVAVVAHVSSRQASPQSAETMHLWASRPTFMDFLLQRSSWFGQFRYSVQHSTCTLVWITWERDSVVFAAAFLWTPLLLRNW